MQHFGQVPMVPVFLGHTMAHQLKPREKVIFVEEYQENLDSGRP